MERINSEGFESLLKDKYGIEWSGTYMKKVLCGALQEDVWTEISEHELIGIMVSEIMLKDTGVQLVPADDGTELTLIFPGDLESMVGGSLYLALKKAVESIEW